MSTSKHDSTVLAMPLNETADALSFRKLSSIPKDIPTFDFIEFFSGHTRVNGWFSDRFGKPRRHFCGDFYGVLSDYRLNLHEELRFTDGITEQRVWSVEVSEVGSFRAASDTLVGDALGTIEGNALRMEYRMKVMIEKGKYWQLNMKDTMVLQADGSLHNITHVYKWGVRIGTVSALYLKNTG